VARILHIVAACTDRKRFVPEVRLRDLRKRRLDERFEEWRRRLREPRHQNSQAQELYAGGYWTIVRGLPEVARRAGWHVELWIASAGYGLVHATRPLVAYSATFSPRQPDSVQRADDPSDSLHRWWHLSTRARRGLGTSLASVADDTRRATILVLASPPYVLAMAEDLARARSRLGPAGALLLVSSAIPTDAGLRDTWVPLLSPRSRGTSSAGVTELRA
jgi:hypothetical protein